jgi:hypothetical protein
VNLHRIGNTPLGIKLNCSIENSDLVETKPRMGLNLKISATATKRKKNEVDEEEPQIKSTLAGSSLQANQLSKGYKHLCTYVG